MCDGESTGVRWVVTQVCNLRGMGGGLWASRFAICWWDMCDEWDKWDIFKL